MLGKEDLRVFGRCSSGRCGKQAAKGVPDPRESLASNAAAGVVPSLHVFVRIGGRKLPHWEECTLT